MVATSGRIARALAASALAASLVHCQAQAPEELSVARLGLVRRVSVRQLALVPLEVIVSAPFAAAELRDGPPVCEAPDVALPLLRSGCPEAPPAMSGCSVEGLECLYPATGECKARFECVYGLWSPVEEKCPEGQLGEARLLRGAGQCESLLPVADTPCDDTGVVCGYQPCALGSSPSVEAECRCGRWYLTWLHCPID